MQAATDYLRGRFPGLEALYVFGSTATGHANIDSDLDLALLARGAVDAAELFDAGLELSRRLDRDVDLVDLGIASTVLAKEVIEHGRLLYCGDRGYVADVEARVLSDYGRLRERTEFIRDAVRADGLAYRP